MTHALETLQPGKLGPRTDLAGLELCKHLLHKAFVAPGDSEGAHALEVARREALGVGEIDLQIGRDARRFGSRRCRGQLATGWVGRSVLEHGGMTAKSQPGQKPSAHDLLASLDFTQQEHRRTIALAYIEETGDVPLELEHTLGTAAANMDDLNAMQQLIDELRAEHFAKLGKPVPERSGPPLL